MVLTDQDKKYLFTSFNYNNTTNIEKFNHVRYVRDIPTSYINPLSQDIHERRRKRKIKKTQHESRNDRKPENNRRNGKNRFCPGQDVATRAFKAQTILDGKIRSKTKMYLGSNYNVTYEVKLIIKDKSSFRPLGKNESIRLQFANDTVGKSSNCEFKEIKGVVPAQFNTSKNYVLFANRIGDHEYKILGPPVKTNKKILQEIRNIVTGTTRGKMFYFVFIFIL